MRCGSWEVEWGSASVERAGEKGSQGGGGDMSGRESEGIVGGEGRRELEVVKGRRMVTKGGW